ncbi:MAG: PTS mannose/fructose/sorbose transporter subunit IIB, partial [Yersiniaceae bacterium]|nr:PTS mannose/fructose/sorbose transporter subunit IIB [Yersiniaceae bacterium]
LPQEIEQLHDIIQAGTEVEIRQVPNDRKVLFNESL